MYVSDMRAVHAIPVLLLLAVLATGCAPERFEEYPPMEVPDDYQEDPDRDAPAPAGFVADAQTAVLHRVRCPLVKEVAPRDRVFFAKPWQALNVGYSPCDLCEPLGASGE
jgi:hypothetical protein